MSGSKYFNQIAWSVTVLTLAITILFMNSQAFGIQADARALGYEDRLFDNTKVHTIDITMNDWDDFIANATSEEYYTANVVIDGEACKNVGIRAKGNTSLSTVAALGSERYSFKIEFDHYDSAGSYHGLDKLSLNNLIQDSTMMKDYLTYTMMHEFGVNASLCSFVYITVNGEDWGLYLAVEGVEEAFLERNYGSGYGELYKPDSMSFGGGRGNGRNFDMNDFNFDSDTSEPDGNSGQSPPSAMSEDGGLPDMPSFGNGSFPEGFDSSQLPGDFDPAAMSGRKENKNGGFGSEGGFGTGSSDVKLQYIDDEPDSYPNIWDNAKTHITKADQNRLIGSLKKLSYGEDIASVVDVEQVICYFVVHNFVCNSDSYTGFMIHNYYLYEENGQMAMIPWDYNLAFGTFQGGNAQATVNTPVDSPVDNGSGQDRPMWNWIVSDEQYTELYHQYFKNFLNSIDIQGIIDTAYHLIKSYVEKDPTAFYTCEEFELGVETLRLFCQMRSESISMQLENGETASNMNYVDASAITLSDMGSMDSGMGGFGSNMPGRPDNTDNFNRPGPGNSQMSQDTEIAGGPPSEQPGEAFSPSGLPENFPGSLPGQPSGNQMENRPFTSPATPSGWIWIIISAAILAAGLAVARMYKK